METNKIIVGDCFKEMSSFPSDSIDMILTSPPYDNLRKYASLSSNLYPFASDLLRVCKEGGVCFWNVDSQVVDGSKTLTPFKQVIVFYAAGWTLNDVIIWRKTNPMPQVRQPRYSHCFEYCFVFCKGKKPKTFIPMTEKCKCAGDSYDSTVKQMDLSRKEKNFQINDEKIMSDVWDIAIAQNKTGHPAVFPLELPLRAIKTWTKEEEVVLDPFCGSGTTCVASKMLGRKWIGIEIDPTYAKEAQDRISGTDISGNADLVGTSWEQTNLFEDNKNE